MGRREIESELVLTNPRSSSHTLGAFFLWQGLSGLVQMPMGCGEQNMILFTPNIYVVQYLESTDQLQPAIQRTAISYMKSGS